MGSVVHFMLLIYAVLGHGFVAKGPIQINFTGENFSTSDDVTMDQSHEAELKDLTEKFQILKKQLDRLQQLVPDSDFGVSSDDKREKRVPRDISQQSRCSPDTLGCENSPNSYPSGQYFSSPPGPRGPPGIMGRDGRDGHDAPIRELPENTKGDGNIQPTVMLRNARGAVYVHWGDSSCPEHSELVYTGYVGGSGYTEKGGGANHMCLHEQPVYVTPVAGVQSHRSYIYGSEYQTMGFPPLNGLHDFDVPCAVCRTPLRQTILMVPARNDCPPNESWTLEYWGYIMAERYNYFRSEYICVDAAAQPISRTSHNTDGRLLFLTEGRCASNGSGLPCGPYIDGHELTCAVCSL